MRRQLVGVGIGVVAAGVGLLPWLVTGGRLPIQNLWATPVTDSTSMPFVLLPFSQYLVVLIVALLITGAAIGGLVARRLPGRRGGLVVGVLVAQVVAIAQSAAVDGGGLQQTRFATLYLALLVGVAVLALVLGAAVMLLIAFAPPAAVVVAVAIAAVPFESWLASLLAPLASTLTEPLRFVPAVAIGAVIVWAGVRTVGRVLAALAALLVLWLGPSMVTAVVNAAGSRVDARDPAAMLEAGRSIFVSASTTAAIVVPPLVLALVVVLIGTLGRVILRARARPEISS